MNVSAIQEAESVTRSIARWGSVAAAVIFGVAFATDQTLSWDTIAGQKIQIVLVLVMFGGYALAWTERYEVLGSAIAVLAIIGQYLRGLSPDIYAPTAIFLAVGAPALFHLAAVVLHRFVLRRREA